MLIETSVLKRALSQLHEFNDGENRALTILQPEMTRMDDPATIIAWLRSRMKRRKIGDHADVVCRTIRSHHAIILEPPKWRVGPREWNEVVIRLRRSDRTDLRCSLIWRNKHGEPEARVRIAPQKGWIPEAAAPYGWRLALHEKSFDDVRNALRAHLRDPLPALPNGERFGNPVVAAQLRRVV